MSQRERAWLSRGEWTYNGAPVSVEDMNAVVERALKEAERELEFCRQHHCAGVRVFCKPEPAAGAGGTDGSV